MTRARKKTRGNPAARPVVDEWPVRVQVAPAPNPPIAAPSVAQLERMLSSVSAWQQIKAARAIARRNHVARLGVFHPGQR